MFEMSILAPDCDTIKTWREKPTKKRIEKMNENKFAAVDAQIASWMKIAEAAAKAAADENAKCTCTMHHIENWGLCAHCASKVDGRLAVA